MFEVRLRQDYEDLWFFREFEVNGVTNGNVPAGGATVGPVETLMSSMRKESPR